MFCCNVEERIFEDWRQLVRQLVLTFNIIITFIIFVMVGEVKGDDMTLEEAEQFFSLTFEGRFYYFHIMMNLLLQMRMCL